MHREDIPSTIGFERSAESTQVEPDRNPNEESQKMCTTRTSGQSHLRRSFYTAIPVTIRVMGNTVSITTYMALDTLVSDCFLDSRLLDPLKAVGTPSEINLSTMRGNSAVSTEVINNLEVMSLDNQERYDLPAVFCQNQWPFLLPDSPRQSDLNTCPYLKDVWGLCAL